MRHRIIQTFPFENSSPRSLRTYTVFPRHEEGVRPTLAPNFEGLAPRPPGPHPWRCHRRWNAGPPPCLTSRDGATSARKKGERRRVWRVRNFNRGRDIMAVFKRGILIKLGIVSKSLFVNKVTKTHFVNNNSSECNLLMIDLYIYMV